MSNAIAGYQSKGYTLLQAKTFALRDAHEDGSAVLTPPVVSGYRAISPRFRNGKVAWTMTTLKGNCWKLVDAKGRDLCSPDLLAPVVYWANDQGWFR